MKRSLLIFAICTISAIVFGQAQRLALLPSALKLMDEAGESYLPTLCVDYFNAVPKGTDKYFANEAIVGSEIKISAKDGRYDRVNMADAGGNSTVPKINKMTLLKTTGNDDALPAHYSSFINNRIEHYKIGGFSALKQEQLQHDVWAYNVLDKLGYLDKSINDPLGRFQAGKYSFKRDIGFSNEAASNATILEFGSLLEEIPHYKEKGISSPIVFKSPGTKKYIVFNDIAPAVYRGFDEDVVASKIYAASGNNDIVINTLGFENSTKETAFQFDMKTKFDMKFSKDISLVSNDLTGESKLLVEDAHHSVFSDFDENKISLKDGFYEGGIVLKSKIGGSSSTVNVVGISTDKSLIKGFFTNLSEQVTKYNEKFKLLFLIKKLKQQAQITKNKRLYVMINQIYAKTFVEIYDGHVINTYTYACK